LLASAFYSVKKSTKTETKEQRRGGKSSSFLFSEAQHYMMKRLCRPEELDRDNNFPETVSSP
jgi:hypothetical protein